MISEGGTLAPPREADPRMRELRAELERRTRVLREAAEMVSGVDAVMRRDLLLMAHATHLSMLQAAKREFRNQGIA